ncbi:MAG: DMT family transporter [Verrucomicrobiota bacterium JB023]|nr:DMT family transporter [Verrucomicrobiota bacterium JB023]
MTEPVSQRKGLVLMVFSVLLFSANVLIIRGAGLNANVDGWMASFTRGVFGFVFVIALYARGRGLELSHLHKPRLIQRGLLGVTGITILYFTIIHLGAGRALVLNLTYPIFSTLIAALVLRETVRPRTIAFMVLSLLGLILFFSNSFASATLSPYDLLGILGAIVAGATVVSIRDLTRTESAATIYSAQCVASIILTAPLAWPSFSGTSPMTWGILAAGAFIVAGGQLLMTRGFHHLPVARGSAMQMLIPPVTALGGWVLFRESFSLSEIIGATITLFATWRISVNR